MNTLIAMTSKMIIWIYLQKFIPTTDLHLLILAEKVNVEHFYQINQPASFKTWFF